MNNDKKKEVDLRLTIRRALAVFDSRDDFNLFLQKEEFVKGLSALSYLKPLEESNGKLIAHLYFRIPNRLSTLKNAFNYVHFDYDEEPKIDKFDETNELSKIIRDLQVKNNNIETIKKVIKYKDVSVQTLQTAVKAEIEAEKPVHEVPPLEEADSQFQLKRVKSERSESNHVKQAYEKLVDILQVMLPLVPSDLALELAPQLAVIEAARRGERYIPEEHPFSVSNFFGKDSEASVTSPILVSGPNYVEKDPNDPGLCTDKMNIEMESGLDPHTEEKKVDVRVDPEEHFYSTPPESQARTQTLKPIAVQAPKHSTVRKIDQKKSVLDQIKYHMEVNHLRYEDIKSISKSKGSNRKNDHPQEWCEAIQHHSKQLKEWEQTLQNSHIYNYNNDNLSEMDRIGWKGNLDISMEISNDFGIRDQFRRASSHWYVSFLIQFWKESPDISVSEIVKTIQEKRKNRTQNGLITWYVDELILLFQLMEPYLKKVYAHKIKSNIIKRNFEHSNSVENLEARIDSLLELYTIK